MPSYFLIGFGSVGCGEYWKMIIIGPQCLQSVILIPIIGPQCLQSVIIILIIGPQCPYSVNLKSCSMSCRTLPGFLSSKNDDFWNFGTYQFSKIVYFLILNNFAKNGSPGQTTMLMRRAAKFCVEPRSPFSEISHHDPETLGKPPSIVSWPECQCFLGSLGSYGI